MAEYVEIIALEAPDSAIEGKAVGVSVTLKNISSYNLSAMVGAYLDYGVTPWPEVSFPYNAVTLSPGESHTFDGSFTMPDSDVTIHAYSYWYGSDGAWHADDKETKDVSLTELVPEFSQFEIVDYKTA